MDRRRFTRILGVSAVGFGVGACADVDEPVVREGSGTTQSTAATAASAPTATVTQTAASQAEKTPARVLDLLRDGNARFVEGGASRRDYGEQVEATAEGQDPYAIVLGCVDSRVPVEVVFDQGVGDVFAARVAGNIVNDDLLGSMEFACSLAGAKAIVVLGHTSCGAVKGAISGAELGNLTGLLEKIEPAIAAVEGDRNADDLAYVNRVAEENVSLTMGEIREKSPLLAEMEADGSIAIAGAMYDVSSGAVRFL